MMLETVPFYVERLAAWQAAVPTLMALLASGKIIETDSYAEHGLWDRATYDVLAGDRCRVSAFARAIARRVRGQTVIDVGTGDRALLATICAYAGAARVIAVEKEAWAAEESERVVRALGLWPRVTVLNEDIRNVRLSTPADVCIAELIGHIASAEGIDVLLGEAVPHILRQGGVIIPEGARTLFAPASRPEVHSDPRVAAGRAAYRQAVKELVPNPVCLRTLVYNCPRSCLLSQPGQFEVLRFAGEVDHANGGPVSLEIIREGTLECFVLWVEIDVDGDTVLSTFSGTCWAPVMLPISGEPLHVRKGERLVCEPTSYISQDGVHRGYQIVALLYPKPLAPPRAAILCEAPYTVQSDSSPLPALRWSDHAKAATAGQRYDSGGPRPNGLPRH